MGLLKPMPIILLPKSPRKARRHYQAGFGDSIAFRVAILKPNAKKFFRGWLYTRKLEGSLWVDRSESYFVSFKRHSSSHLMQLEHIHSKLPQSELCLLSPHATVERQMWSSLWCMLENTSTRHSYMHKANMLMIMMLWCGLRWHAELMKMGWHLDQEIVFDTWLLTSHGHDKSCAPPNFPCT